MLFINRNLPNGVQNNYHVNMNPLYLLSYQTVREPKMLGTIYLLYSELVTTLHPKFLLKKNKGFTLHPGSMVSREKLKTQ
jgi:hypothetical protein